MNTELKNDDLQSLVKEQVRLTKWLVRIVLYQAILLVTAAAAYLWVFGVSLLKF